MVKKHQEKLTLQYELDEVTITITSNSEQAAKQALKEITDIIKY